MFKFERLKVYQLALEYIDRVYEITAKLPRNEEYNLNSQMRRAATSIALNIAEGSTGQSDPEQARFLSMAIRSLLETVACRHIIERRGYLKEHPSLLKELGGLERDARSQSSSNEKVGLELTPKTHGLERSCNPLSIVRGLSSANRCAS